MGSPLLRSEESSPHKCLVNLSVDTLSVPNPKHFTPITLRRVMLVPTPKLLLLLNLLLHCSSGSPLTIFKQVSAEVQETRHQLLVQAMVEGLKSSLKEILAGEVKEEMKGEVTAWFPNAGEKPERELLATLDFSLKMHQGEKYGEANTIHFDFKPQTRSDIQSESEYIWVRS